MKSLSGAMIASAIVLAFAPAAAAKDARCYTSDDGAYPCDFQRLDNGGSFRISAEGKPTFELWIEGDGKAFANAVFSPGGRAVPLPGSYLRSKKDAACWVGDATGTEICAWS